MAGPGLGMARRGGEGYGEAMQGKQQTRGNEMTVKISKPTEIIQRRVRLCGMTEIMFDRYAGDNKTKLEPWQKLYLQPGDSRVIGIPALNIMSFLTAHNTNSAPKRLRDKRQYKDICNACLSFVSITPAFIHLVRNNEPIVFERFIDDVCPKSGVYIHRAVARLDKGIPNPKERPVVPLPWAIEFTLSIFPNKEIKEVEIQNLIEEGGRALGLGTFRGVFGKFYIESWE